MQQLFLPILLLAVFQTPNAQNPASIIAKHIEVMGGTALDSLETAIMEADMAMLIAPDVKNPMRMTIVHQQAYRMELKTAQVVSTVFVSGNKGWNIANLMGQRKKLPIDSVEAGELRYQTDLTGPLHRYREKGYAVSYIGLDTLENKATAYVFKVEFAPQTTYWCYLDTTSLLEVKRRVEVPINRKLHSMELTFSDYRRVGRVMKPYQIAMQNKRGTITYTYTSILLNPPVDRKALAAEE
ncbi:MAG: hypothetical protein SFV22_05095 [Saprospiraceae bacterium]|nr:hypothetical protein [Saprospiraceae bacterium]